MSRIIINIPKEFKKDEILDVLKRISSEIAYRLEHDEDILSCGLIEQETCEMLHEAFKESTSFDYDDKGKNKIDSFRGEHFFLSNFFTATVTYKGLTYQNNEAAFQAQKCVIEDERKQFVSLTGAEAKKAGRRVQLRKDWEAVKVGEMREIVKAKFFQNPNLAEKLLATGDMVLEEGNNWGDKTWGTVNGFGQNLLGKILMEVRDMLNTAKQKY